MTDEPELFTDQVRGQLERLHSRGLIPVALVAFVFGVLLHACVIYAVLDDAGGSKPAGSPAPGRPASAATVAAAPAVPTRPPDRNSCDAIRGTDYRSEAERQFFLTNCR